MINEDQKSKLKSALSKLNNELKFEDFSLKLERETNGKFTFSHIKELLDKFYPKTNKNDKNALLKQINLDVKTGLISILQFFGIVSACLDKSIISPVLAYYKIADCIEKKNKQSTLEFIYKLGLLLDAEINMREFYEPLKNSLRLDDMILVIVFKGLDYNKKGKIRVEDFVLVIDSYREDLLEDGGSLEVDIKSELQKLKTSLEHKFLSITEIYKKIELHNLNYAEYGQMFKVLKEELTDGTADNRNLDENIKNVLNSIKKEGNKIFEEDFDKALAGVESLGNNKNNTNDYSNNLAKINLNEVQLYWLNKYILLLEGINVTDKMMFEVAKDSKTGILHLENLKKKIKLMLPIGRISAMDLNTMIEALDVNKKKFLSLKDYEEIMNFVKNEKEEDNNENNNKDKDSSKEKSQNKQSLMNTWVRGHKSVNYHLLPVKGNHKILELIDAKIEADFNAITKDMNKTESANTNKLDNNKQLLLKEDDLHLQATQSALPGTNFNDLTHLDIDKDESQIIDVFENFNLIDPQGNVPSFDLFHYLHIRLSDEIVTRSNISDMIRQIDANRDGFITHNDIIQYLLHFYKHRSTKLSFKKMANKIYNELKQTAEQFFTSYGIDLESELSITSLCEMLYNLFEFENPISKKIYDEMRVIYASQKRKLTVIELIDLIEEFKIEVKMGKDENNEMKNNSASGFINLREFEESIRQFVLNLIDDHTQNVDLSMTKQNINKFRENIKCAVRLENQMNLQQFKDAFIKPLRMDISLGVAIFQILKNFTHKNEQMITREDLITFLESYIDKETNQNCEDVSTIVNSLEHSGCPLKFVFENLPYNSKGFVTCVDFICILERFYPSFTRTIFYKLLPELDESRHGVIYYENLQNFLFENSKRDKSSLSLEIKKMASEIDRKALLDDNMNKSSLEYFSSLPTPINNYNSVKKNEHLIITDKLCSNKIMKEELFHFLCQKCGNVNGYDITVLSEMIDYYRGRDYVDIMNSNNNNFAHEENETEELSNAVNEINQVLISNKNLNFDLFLNNLKIGEQGEIAVIEIMKVLSTSLSLEKSKIAKIVKSLDVNKTGYVSFPDFHNKLKDYFKEKYRGSILLNAKYLFSSKIKADNIVSESEIKNFIFSKLSDTYKANGLSTLLSKDNFSSLFLDYFLNDLLLFNQFFIVYQEKGAKNKGMICLQKFYEYIRDNNKDLLQEESSSDNLNKDEELDNNVFHLLNDLEENKVPMKNFFDFLNHNFISKDGFYQLSEMRKLFKEKLSVSEEGTEHVIRMFENKTEEFNLVKFAEYVLLNCEKSHLDINALVTQMATSITKYNISSYNGFLKKFLLKKDLQLSIKDMLIGFPPIFKLSFYECINLYLDIQNALRNNYDTDIIISFDFIFNHYKLINSFKPQEEASERKQNKSAVDSSLKLCLSKLSDFLEIEKDKAKLFKSFDSDKNGVLSTTEFLNALNSFKDLNLNDSQKISLLKVADKNSDGKINYVEFLDFLKHIKNKSKDDVSSKLSINKKSAQNVKKGFIPKIEVDFKKIKINYEMNSRKINPQTSDKLTNYLFILQEDFYTNFNKFENIEQDFNTVDLNTSYCIEKDNFLLVIKKRLLKIEPKVSESLINFAHEGLNSKEKEKYKSEMIVNYKSFLMNLVNFRVTSVKAPPGPPPNANVNNNKNKSGKNKQQRQVEQQDEEEEPEVKKKSVKGNIRNKSVPVKKQVQQEQDYEENVFDDAEDNNYQEQNEDEDEEEVYVASNNFNKNITNTNKNANMNKNTNMNRNTNASKNSSRPKSSVNNNKQSVTKKVQDDWEEDVFQTEEDKAIQSRPKTATKSTAKSNVNNKANIKVKPKPIPKKVPDPPVEYDEDNFEDYNPDPEFDPDIDQEPEPVKLNKQKVTAKANAKPNQKSGNIQNKNNFAPKSTTNSKNTKCVQFKENILHDEEEVNNEKEEEEIQQIKQPQPKTNQVKKSAPNAPNSTQKLVSRKIFYKLDHEDDQEEKAKLGQVFLGNIGSKIDLNNGEDLEKAQAKMKNLFSCKNDKSGEDKSLDNGNVGKLREEEQKENFKDFISKINNLDYRGYDYKINPAEDYFKGFDGKVIETILNSEDAAIRKCEEIYNGLKEGEKFFDKDFGSQPTDNGIKNKFSLYLNGNAPKGGTDPNIIEWYRLGEVSKDSAPVFIDDGVESNDVMQGALGDCWFISALSVLATKDHLLRGEFNESIVLDGTIDDEENVMLSTGVYPPIFHGFRKKSIFCIRFFKNFKWRYVIIDDRLPCKKVYSNAQVPKLIYGKCRLESEFWVPLIEKAYAKLHGNYESLISGFIDDGLVDLTSFVSKKYVITPEDRSNADKSNELWELIKCNSSNSFGKDEQIKDKLGKEMKAKFFTRNNTMMGCSIDAKVVESEVLYQNRKSGVLAGHAYAILDAFEIPKPHGLKRKFSRLLRIRNPWGFKEWQGKWSDESEEIDKNKQRVQNALSEKYSETNEKIVLDREDGTFIMCFRDFRSLFSKLFICYDFPPSIVGLRYFDKWTKEQSGGLPVNNTENELKAFGKNPQYYLHLDKPAKVYISLMQNDGRLSKSKFPYPEVTKKACIIIARTTGKQKMEVFDNDLMVEISPVRQHREISIQRELPAGDYLIIPAVLREGDVGGFCMEFYFPDVLKNMTLKTDQVYYNLNDKITYTKIDKLGIKAQCELIMDDRADEIKSVNEMKTIFIYSQFQNMLKDMDNADYSNIKGKAGKNLQNANDRKKSKMVRQEEEEEEDWDEY